MQDHNIPLKSAGRVCPALRGALEGGHGGGGGVRGGRLRGSRGHPVEQEPTQSCLIGHPVVPGNTFFRAYISHNQLFYLFVLK